MLRLSLQEEEEMLPFCVHIRDKNVSLCDRAQATLFHSQMACKNLHGGEMLNSLFCCTSKHTPNRAVSICSGMRMCDILTTKTPKAEFFSAVLGKSKEFTNSRPSYMQPSPDPIHRGSCPSYAIGNTKRRDAFLLTRVWQPYFCTATQTLKVALSLFSTKKSPCTLNRLHLPLQSQCRLQVRLKPWSHGRFVFYLNQIRTSLCISVSTQSHFQVLPSHLHHHPTSGAWLSTGRIVMLKQIPYKVPPCWLLTEKINWTCCSSGPMSCSGGM